MLMLPLWQRTPSTSSETRLMRWVDKHPTLLDDTQNRHVEHERNSISSTFNLKQLHIASVGPQALQQE
jgi:hypothetical protein